MGGVNRRQAVKLAATTGAAAALGAGAASAQQEERKKAPREPEERRKKGRQFSGTSKKGDIKEALDLAIQEAAKTAKGADRMVRWTLREISGVNGGIAGLHEVTVTIDAGIS